MSAKRVTFAPSALVHGPRPTEREIYRRDPPAVGQGRPAILPQGGGQHKQRVHTNPQHYSWLTEQLSPPSPLGAGLGRAFWVGGLICVLGQAIADAGIHWLDMNARTASSLTSITLVFLTALLTGVGVFDKLGKYAGAGSFVPITGFANAMVSPALEFRREGLVLGLGAKLFSIAGPVLVYGIGASVLVGVVYALFFR